MFSIEHPAFARQSTWRLTTIHGFVLWLLIPISLVAKEPTIEPLDKVGIVDRQPDDVRSIESSRGYLTAYTAKIPGTEVTFEMLPIPGGTFFLGSPTDEASRQSGEGPQVRANVPPMWMGKCEVTWAEYKQYMQLLPSRGRKTPHKLTVPPRYAHPTEGFLSCDLPRSRCSR